MSHNVKTVQRALDAAEDYVNKNMAPNAKRDLDRAKSYLDKCPEEDQQVLLDRYQALEVIVLKAEEEAQAKRLLTGVERQFRYAKEAVEKKNANDVRRYLVSARREIAKLPESFQKAQEDIAAELDKQATQVEERVKADGILRQLDREMKNGAAAEKLYTLIDKLPESLQEKWSNKVNATIVVLNNNKPKEEASSSPRSVKAEADIVIPPISLGGTTTPTTDDAAADGDDEPLAPGIARMMDRSMNGIADYINRKQFDQAENSMDRARSDTLSKIPTERHQQPYLAKLDDFDKTIEEGKRQQKVELFMKAVERAYGMCQDLLDDTRRHASDLVDKMEFRVQMTMDLLKDDDPLSAEEKESILQKFQHYKDEAAKCVDRYRLEEATTHLERYEEAYQEIANGGRNDMVDAYGRNTMNALEATPDGEEKEKLLTRMKDIDNKLAAREALADKEKNIERLKDHWTYTKVDGADEEQMKEYPDWKATKFLGIDKTKEAVRKYSEFLKSEWVTKCALLEDEVADVLDEAKKAYQTNVNKLAACLKTTVSNVKQEFESQLPLWSRKDLVSGLKTLRSVESEPYLACDNSEGVLSKAAAAVSQMIDVIQDDIDKEEQGAGQKYETAQKNASELWPKMSGQYDTMDLDPADAVANPSTWKGKFIKIQGKQNRLGWDFETDGFHFIRKMDGVPIAAKFDGAVLKTLKEMEEDFDFERKNQEFEGLIIQVTSVGKVVPISWNHNWKRWDRSAPLDAVVGTIVAFHSAAFAADWTGTKNSAE